jgi:bifunctional ADP-heptose synthase (sugar kinase/adenylyltransferase)
MAIYTHETLALGQLPATQTDLYDPAAGVTGLVHNITLHNINTIAETVELWKHNGTTAFQIAKLSLAANETLIISFSNDGMTVDGAHKIQGKSATAAKVTYDISGTKVVL